MRRNLFICLLLAAAVCAVYVQAVGFDFVNYDDPIYVSENEQVLQGLTAENILWALTSEHGGNWHPLTGISHMTDCELFGLAPGGHHAVNVILHAINTLVVFWLLTAMTGAAWRSALVAALFGLHPLHVESVAWISERKDVLSAFFWLLSMWAYLAYTRRGGSGRYLLTMLFLTLGLMAKPMVVTLPLALLLLDYWPLGRMRSGLPGQRSILFLVIEKIPLLVLAAIASGLTVLFQRGAGAVMALDEIPLLSRVANALVSYVFYLAKTFWPSGLAVRYPHPNLPGGTPWEWWQVAGAGLLLALITGLVVRSYKKRYLFFGWFWFVGTLVPVIGLVQVGTEARADRYTYIPLAGVFIIAAWGVPELLAKRRHRKVLFFAAASLAVAALSVCSWFQARHWTNSITLGERSIAVTEGNYMMQNNLGNALADAGRLDEAIELYRHALRIHPTYPDTYNNLGTALTEQGLFAEAVDSFYRALRLQSDNAEVHFNLGYTLSKKKRFQEATRHYDQALRLDGRQAKWHNAAGITLAEQGRMPEAMQRFSAALRLDPDFAATHFNIGKALMQQGNLPDAISSFIKAISLDPEYAEAHSNLGVARAMQGNQAGAIESFRASLRADPEYAEAHSNMGLALSGQGESDLAIEHFEQAIRLDPELLNARMGLAMLFEQQGKINEAIKQYSSLLQIFPNHGAARANLKRLRSENNQ